MFRLLSALFVSTFTMGNSAAADLKVLSAGAVEPGVEAFAHQVKRELGHDLKIQFNTASQIAKRLADGEASDILISPPGAITQAGDQGLVCRQGR